MAEEVKKAGASLLVPHKPEVNGPTKSQAKLTIEENAVQDLAEEEDLIKVETMWEKIAEKVLDRGTFTIQFSLVTVMCFIPTFSYL